MTENTAPAATAADRPGVTRPTSSGCLCGCGQTPGTNRSYRPGHDARHAGIVGRFIASIWDDEARRSEFNTALENLPSIELRQKALAMAHRLVAAAEARAEAEAKRATRRRAGKTAPEFVEGTVKLGRWTYPARKYVTSGEVTVNTKRDGSGNWVPAATPAEAAKFRPAK